VLEEDHGRLIDICGAADLEAESEKDVEFGRLYLFLTEEVLTQVFKALFHGYMNDILIL
jgi:hypothetical protein